MTVRYTLHCGICGMQIHRVEREPLSFGRALQEIGVEIRRKPAATFPELIGSATARMLGDEAAESETVIREHFATRHPRRLWLFDRLGWRWLIRGISGRWWPIVLVIVCIAGFMLATAVFAMFELLTRVQIP